MIDLAATFTSLGYFEKSTTLEEKVFDLQRTRLGSEYRETLMAMVNLAVTYQGGARVDDAIRLEPDFFLEKQEKVAWARSLEHPETLMTMTFVAQLYKQIGQGESPSRQYYISRLRLQTITGIGTQRYTFGHSLEGVRKSRRHKSKVRMRG
jgi:hypothetical protein